MDKKSIPTLVLVLIFYTIAFTLSTWTLFTWNTITAKTLAVFLALISAKRLIELFVEATRK